MSIKKNFLYNGILSVSNYVFPFLTFPYVSRVIGVDNLGKVSFADSVINYFLLFASLGIGTIGIREIAKNKNNPQNLSKIFSSLLTLNLLTTIIVALSYIIAILYISNFQSYKELLYIGIAKIMFSLFLIEWFFAGIENFRFITIRSLLIKVCYIISVYFFVKKPEDYDIYFFLTVFITVLSALCNLYYAKNFVKFSIKEVSLKKFFKPVLIMGIYGLLTYMYTSFNVIYLGIIAGNREVGYYTTAIKIYTILLSIFTALTTVMLPRISQLVAEKKMEEIKMLIYKTYDTLFFLSIPLILIGTLLAPQIIELIAGPGFEGAILPMQIVMPLILIIGIAQILIIQILMPFNNDKYIFLNSIIGALVGVILNVLLVNKLQGIGSAIVLVSSELAVVISANYFVRKEVKFKIPYYKIIYYFLYSIPCLLFCKVAIFVFDSSLLITVSVLIISLGYFFIMQKLFIKNTLLIEVEKSIKISLFSLLKK